MIANLTPYPAYKASGMGWLKAVPEHWEILNHKNPIQGEGCSES